MKIFLFGCGAIGSNLLPHLVADYNQADYTIIDKDKVESRNIQARTQFYFREQVGMPKVKALRVNIHNFFEKRVDNDCLEITEKNINSVFFTALKPQGSIEVKRLVIDAFDNAKSRNIIKKYCLDNHFDCVHIGFSPQYTFEVTWNENYIHQDSANQGIDICEMPGARAFVNAVAGLAAQVILDFLRKSNKINLVGNKFITKVI